MSRNGLLSIIGSCCLALGTLGAQAQVSVNAPSALNKRSINGNHPAQSSTTTQQQSQPAQPKKDTASKPANHEATSQRGNQAEKQPAAEHKQPEKQPTAETTTRRNNSSSSYSSSSYSSGTRTSTTTGYRIQAYSDNNASKAKQNATSRARAIALKFPQYRTYITYKAPSWRLRIGDFTSQRAAQEALTRMKRIFPSYALTIVRDRINVWK